MDRRRGRDRTRVSYVKKQMARRSKVSLGLTVAALVLFAVSMGTAIRSEGAATISIAGMGLSSLLVSIVGGIYAIAAFWEREKNYILAKVSVFLCGTLIIIWLIMIFIGLGG